MFIHRRLLQPLLTPSDYYSQATAAAEQEHIFLPHWHAVATLADVPFEGSFLAFDLFERPLLLVRGAGRQCRAFLNVCSHRGCRIVGEGRGRANVLRCQYHGWEYNADGRTAKIPDAGCFRPFDRENAKLKPIRLEACGDLLFVCLSPEGPSLYEFLGDQADEISRCFAAPWRQVARYEYSYAANWKIPIENSMETYHVPCVHKGYFAGVYPREEMQEHNLNEKATTLHYDLSDEPGVVKREALVRRLLGGPRQTGIYTHHIVHPNHMFVMTDLIMTLQVFFPCGPRASRSVSWVFTLGSRSRAPWVWAAERALSLVGRNMVREVQTEDAAIFPQVQQGLEASPFTGCLGTREERIYAFQYYVAKSLQRAVPPWLTNPAPRRFLEQDSEEIATPSEDVSRDLTFTRG